MSTRVYLQYTTVTTSATALSATALVLDNVQLTGKATNSGAITLTIGGSTSTLEQGEWVTLKRVDLKDVSVNGTAGDVVKVMSGVAG